MPKEAAIAALPPPSSLISDEGTNSALQKAFAILEAVVRAGAPLSIAELELQLRMPKTSIQRVVQQLEANGLVVRDATGRRYGTGGRLRRFGLDVLVASTRMSPAHLVLRDLVEEIGESCNFGILNGASVVYIDRVECKWPLRSHLVPGSTAPIHCTGIGKLLLAHLPQRDRDQLIDTVELTRHTERTITNAGALKRQLDRIREEDVAVNDQENMVGMVAIAVPVRSPDGRVIAGVALEAPVPRLSLEEAKRHIPTLRRAAAELGKVVATDQT
jgi:DNA-binding IclR family transcriptional regulator